MKQASHSSTGWGGGKRRIVTKWAHCYDPHTTYQTWDMGQRMKFSLCALSVIALAAVFPSAAKAEAQSYPWCAITDLGDVVENCYFDNLEQCKASLGGTHDFCVKNNTYKPPPPEGVSAESAAPAQAAASLAPAKKPKGHSTSRPPAQ